MRLLLSLIYLVGASGQGSPAKNQLDRFNPSTVPFAGDRNRYQPTLRSEYFVTLTYVADWFGRSPDSSLYLGQNHSSDDLVTQCPPGTAVLKVAFASMGLPAGHVGRCPANYHQMSGKERPLPWPIRTCRSYDSQSSFRYSPSCHAPDTMAITQARCLGFSNCSHLPNTTNYRMSCPAQTLFEKSFAVTIMCGTPVITKVTPDVAPYDEDITVYLSGPVDPNPGSFVNVTHQAVRITIGDTTHTLIPTFISPRILKISPPRLKGTNRNVSATVTLSYNNLDAVSNPMRFKYVAPVFFNLNATTVSARHGAVVLLEGDYFVNTTTILVRVTIEDGSVKTGTAQFVSRTLLLLRLPSHNVPLYIYGLSARLEVAFHTDDLGNPYWQVVSPLSNDATKAMKLQYFDASLFPSNSGLYNIEFGVRSTSSIWGSWLHIEEFKHVQDLGSTEICRYQRNDSTTAISDPLYEIPPQVSNVLQCFNVARQPLRSLGGSDIMIKKYNSSRQLIWANRIGGVGNDVGAAIATDSVGNVFVSGAVYGLSTLTSKVLTIGSDEFYEVQLVGSSSSKRVRRMFIAKYDRGGKLLWVSEVGTCMHEACKIETVSATSDGYVVVTGSFFGTVSFGLMCQSEYCKTARPAMGHTIHQSRIECIQQGMEAFNSSCDNPVPVTVLQSSAVCEKSHSQSHLCLVDTFVTMWDHNGTLVWAKNSATNQTWMRHTPLFQHFSSGYIQPWENSALLAYRSIPEKLAASTDPNETLRLLNDRYLNVYPLFNGLKDAYHLELQANKTRLTRASIQECISAVNSAFDRIKLMLLKDGLSFFHALSSRSAYILKVPDVVMNHSGIQHPAMQLKLGNTLGYQARLLSKYKVDMEFDSLNRASIIPEVNSMNNAIDNLATTVDTLDRGKVERDLTQPGLMFSQLQLTMLTYYARRILAMRQAWGNSLLHREMQMAFLTQGSVIEGYPSRPTQNEMQRGGQDLILRISGDQFKPLTQENKQIIIDNLVSTAVTSTSFETKVKPWLRTTEGMSNIVASDANDMITITFPFLGAANYSIPEPETIVMSIPSDLTQYGSIYPFFAEFFIRKDPIGIVWNTNNVKGDLYSRPLINDLRYKNTTMTIYLAGDRVRTPLTDESKLKILENIVVTGNDDTEPVYVFETHIKQDLRENLERITEENDGAIINVDLRGNDKYDIWTAETVTMTIPGSVTELGFDHAIGSFSVRATVKGTIMTSMSANNLGGGGSYFFEWTIAGDRFAPKSKICVAAMVNEIHSPNVPFVENGWMETAVPLLKDLDKTYPLWSVSADATSLKLLVPKAVERGYYPKTKETISTVVPAECTLSGHRHHFEPFNINPGDASRDAYLGEADGVVVYLPENQMKY